MLGHFARGALGALLIVGLVGCGDGTTTDDAGTDAAPRDGGEVDGGRADGGRVDGGGGVDAGDVDGSPPGDDGGATDGGADTDGGSVDAGRDAGSDAGSMGRDAGADAGSVGRDAGSCGASGTACQPSAGRECPISFACYGASASAGGVCVPNHMATCGFIACPPSTFPQCLLPPGSTGGPCVTSAEYACVCMSARGRMIFSGSCP